jgi:hypothetical protein
LATELYKGDILNQNYDDNIYEWPSFAMPQKEELYNRKKALPYWLRLPTHDAIITLSVEMLSSIGHIRIGVSVLNAELDKDKIILFREKTSLANFQEELSNLYEVVHELASVLYRYGAIRKKDLKENSSEGGQEILSIGNMEFPTRFSKILDFPPKWDQQTPEKFLSLVIPLFDTKLLQLGNLIIKFRSETKNNNALLGNGKFTLNTVASEMLRGFNIVNEEFFLLKSCINYDHK